MNSERADLQSAAVAAVPHPQLSSSLSRRAETGRRVRKQVNSTTLLSALSTNHRKYTAPSVSLRRNIVSSM